MKPTASATVVATVSPGSQRRRRCPTRPVMTTRAGSEAAVAPVALELVARQFEADQYLDLRGAAASQRNALLELLANHDAAAALVEGDHRDEILARQHVLLPVDHGDEIG